MPESLVSETSGASMRRANELFGRCYRRRGAATPTLFFRRLTVQALGAPKRTVAQIFRKG